MEKSRKYHTAKVVSYIILSMECLVKLQINRNAAEMPQSNITACRRSIYHFLHGHKRICVALMCVKVTSEISVHFSTVFKKCFFKSLVENCISHISTWMMVKLN